MLATLICSIALVVPSVHPSLPTRATPASSVVVAAVTPSDPSSYLTAEERSLLTSNPQMLAVGGVNEVDDEVLFYLMIGAVSVGAIVLLIVLGG